MRANIFSGLSSSLALYIRFEIWEQRHLESKSDSSRGIIMIEIAAYNR